MAKPITETPRLEGKDARNFINNMKASEVRKATAQELARIKADFAKIHALAK